MDEGSIGHRCRINGAQLQEIHCHEQEVSGLSLRLGNLRVWLIIGVCGLFYVRSNIFRLARYETRSSLVKECSVSVEPRLLVNQRRGLFTS